MKLFFTLSLVVVCVESFAQALFNNNGANVYVKDGGFVIIKTNSLYNTQIAGAGLIDNAGTVVVEGNISNDGSITGDGDTIRLSGNWLNNNSYTGSNSWVEMNGGNQQITGTAVTTFDNLNLLGGNVVKRQTIDAVTSGLLVLNDAELATDVNEMLVSNSNTNAIARNSGFVSSLNTGKLSRSTNSTGAYLFPTGSPSYNNPPSIFRPVEFRPASSTVNEYGAMVVKGDATNEGYNVNTVDDILCKVNQNFYHKLYHSNGNDGVALKMYFDAAIDGDWSDEAHWDSPNRWNYINTSTVGSGLGFSTVSVIGVNNFSPEPFALARKKFTLAAGPDVSISLGQATLFNPLIGTANVSAINWSPQNSLSCTNCESPTASPTSTTEYTISVTDNTGCVVTDALTVSVAESNIELLIPTAFSPNGDGVNDFFRILNKQITKCNLQVYNRWGEKVFETNDPQEGWDGIYEDMEQGLGVYVWHCSYMLSGDLKMNTAKGNVTLVR